MLTIWRIPILCCKFKAKDKHSEYVIIIVSYSNNDSTNTFLCYTIRTWPAWFVNRWLTIDFTFFKSKPLARLTTKFSHRYWTAEFRNSRRKSKWTLLFNLKQIFINAEF